ncbi:hypothetical protein AGDE_13545 [Angomonas deanei]|uniref:ER-Golgi trafficking TRAPP I complex 85 kDa subunit, putative n=1 Tax=Angomonas deanei TaxID=59799 RepID=A0A7G2CEC5_9TRYP|nr:hypothetical protein AGDE_13545 [Angomonas deanei]CAD2217337.1 ER-Golgi trafficking TRAPP I complex 85 kDa subunit, putative [Angomonas deanei]|eukprot:EPY22215.1 hypothetical protein AGDE_13545 [Angomonas deanei]
MSAQFTKFLEERYTRPVVVVTASPAAERSSNKNGLDVVHLLRPFSVHDGTAYAHIGERSENYAVRHFGVRLVRPTCVREAGEDEIYRYLIRSLKTTAPMDLAYGEQLDRSVQELMTPPASAATQVSAGGPLPRPVRLTSSNALTGLLDRSHPAWHSRFMKDISFLTRCAPFDTLDHPIGIISVASTAEAGGIEGCLQVLQTQVRLAAEVRAGLHSMDSEMHKYFILLHDVTDPASPSNEVARDMLRAAQQRFSSNSVALVRINSVDNPRDHKCMDPSPFMEANQPCYDVPSAAAARQYEEEQQAAATALEPVESNASLTSLVSTSTTMIGSVPNSRYLRYHGVHGHFGKWDNQTPKVTGCCLSPQDIQELRTTMNYYLTQALLRHVERRLRAMDIVVEEKRTTTLGRVAAWLKGRTRPSPS